MVGAPTAAKADGTDEWQQELRVADCMVVDVASARRKLAIEVDGPTHYNSDLLNSRHSENGATRLRFKTSQKHIVNVID